MRQCSTYLQRLGIGLGALLLSGTLLLGGCKSRGATSTIVSTSVAEATLEGQVRDRAPTQFEADRASNFAKRIADVNAQFPPPEIPFGLPVEHIVSITKNGELVTESGSRFRLGGLDCGEALRNGLENEANGRLAVRILRAGPVAQVPLQAYAWIVKLGADSETGEGKPVQYRSINDLAAINGWCSPSHSGQFAERYAALSKIPKELKIRER